MKKLMILAVVALAALAVASFADDELNLSAGWTWTKNGASRILNAAVTRFDVAGDAVVQNVQTMTTNAVALTLGNVTAPGFGYFHNLHATNTCQVGIMSGTNFVPFVQLGPLEYCMGFFVTNAPYARKTAATGVVNLDYAISER
jgi:hypothetical protein